MWSFLVYLIALVVIFYAVQRIILLAQFRPPWEHIALVIALVLFIALVSFTLAGYLALPKVLT